MGSKRRINLAGGCCALAVLVPSCSQGTVEEKVGVQSQAQDNRPGWSMGVRCQADFQNNWDPNWNNYGMCQNFINGVNGSHLDSVSFYYNLHGAQGDIQNSSDTCLACGGADSVDFFLMATHGGIDSTQARFAMWDMTTRAWTGSMVLGDDGQQLKVLATFSCDTLATSDGHFIDRWGGVFNGGLKIAVGAYDLVYSGNDQKGTEFASRIENSEPVGFAWNQAVWYADNSNHPLAAATGVDSTDCSGRRQANLGTALSMAREQSWGYACWSGWN
jgi:hypothetical protein